jgi:hypothetical protein
MVQEKTANAKEKSNASVKSPESVAALELSRLSSSGMISTESKDWQKALELIKKNEIPERTVDEIETKLLSFYFKNGFFRAKDKMEEGLNLPHERVQHIAREAGKIALEEVRLNEKLETLKSNGAVPEKAMAEREKAIVEKLGLIDEDLKEVDNKVNNVLKSAEGESLKKEILENEKRNNYYYFGGSKPRQIIHNTALIGAITTGIIIAGMPASVFIIYLLTIPYFGVSAVAATISAEVAILVGRFYYKHKDRAEEEKRKS